MYTLRENKLVYCVALAAFFFQFESFMVIVSLPDMAREMNASAHAVSYIVSGLFLGLVSTLFFSTRLGQHFGYPRLFKIGTYITIVATLSCGITPNLLTLIFCRIIQGAGIGCIVSSSYALLPLGVRSDRLGWAFGALSTGAGAGMVLGLPIGGFIASYFEWRWLFLGSIPCLVLLSIWANTSIPQNISIANNRSKATSMKNTLKIPSVWIGLTLMLAFQGVASGFRFFIPFVLEHQIQVSTKASSIILLSYPLGFLLLSTWAGKRTDSRSPTQLMKYGCILGLLTFLCYSLTTKNQEVWQVALLLIFLGMSAGFFTAPNNVYITRGRSPSEIQDLSSLIPITLNTSFMLGTLIFSLPITLNDPKFALLTGTIIFSGIILVLSTQKLSKNKLIN